MPSKLLLGAFASHSATTPTMQRTAARVTMGNALHSIRRVCSSGLNRVFGRAALVTPTATPSRSQPIAFLTTRPSSTIAAPAFAPSPAFGVTPNHLQLPIRRHFLRHPHSHSHSLSSPRSHRRLFSLNSTPAAHQAVLGRLDLTPPREGEMDDEGRVYDPRLRSEIWKHVLFAILFTGGAFTVAAYFENKRRAAGVSWTDKLQQWRREMADYRYISQRPPTDAWERVKRMLNLDVPWSPGQHTAAALLAINVVVFGMWAVSKRSSSGALTRIMNWNFLEFPPARRYVTHVTSMFSHAGGWHMLFNCWALWSFGPPLINSVLGAEQFLALYLSAGVVSSVVSLLHQSLTHRYYPSLGASGAIYALFSIMAASNPHSQVTLMFVMPLELWQAMGALILFDVAGLLFKFTNLGHAAHLGGMAFGAWYAVSGATYWKNRDEYRRRLQSALSFGGASKP